MVTNLWKLPVTRSGLSTKFFRAVRPAVLSVFVVLLAVDMSNERTRNLLRPEKNSLLLKYVNPGHYEIEVIFIDGIFSQFDASAYSVECAMITFDSWVHEPSMSNGGWIQLCFILSQSLLHGDIYSLRVRIPPAQKSRSCLLRLSKRATNHCCFQQQTNNKGHEVLGEQNTIMVNF